MFRCLAVEKYFVKNAGVFILYYYTYAIVINGTPVGRAAG